MPPRFFFFLWFLDGQPPQENTQRFPLSNVASSLASASLFFLPLQVLISPLRSVALFLLLRSRSRSQKATVCFIDNRGRGWSMTQHYWPGDMGPSKDKLCWRDDQANFTLCLASSAIWALKPNPAMSQGQTTGPYGLYYIGVKYPSSFQSIIIFISNTCQII